MPRCTRIIERPRDQNSSENSLTDADRFSMVISSCSLVLSFGAEKNAFYPLWVIGGAISGPIDAE